MLCFRVRRSADMENRWIYVMLVFLENLVAGKGGVRLGGV